MTFATCLNCIDGRVQIPVIEWITENYGFKYVDMITKPGMDGFLSKKSSDISEIIKEIQITIDVHNSKNIFITGHYDCAGNPVDNDAHKRQIKKSVKRIKDLFNDLNVVGLWVSSNFSVTVVVEN